MARRWSLESRGRTVLKGEVQRPQRAAKNIRSLPDETMCRTLFFQKALYF